MKELEVVEAESKQEILSALEEARAFVIASNEDMLKVDAHCSGLLRLKKKVEADFADSKTATYAAWKVVVAQEKGHLDGIEEARKIDKQKIGDWQMKQEDIRRMQERAAQEVARKAAEDAQIKAAAEAEKAGDKAQAEAIISAPVVVPPVIIPKSVPKAATVLRRVWKYRLTGKPVPPEYTMPDEVKIGKVVRATEGAAFAGQTWIECFSENV